MSAHFVHSHPCLDPIWDATDGACPAWWRGCDNGIDHVLDIIESVLQGHFQRAPSFGYERLNIVVNKLRILVPRGGDDHVPVHDGSTIYL